MNKETFIKAINRLKSYREKHNQLIAQLKDLFGPDSFDGPVCELVFEYEKAAIECLSALVGDDTEWVGWFLTERNDRRDKVSIGTKSWNVKNASDLWDVIEYAKRKARK